MTDDEDPDLKPTPPHGHHRVLVYEMPEEQRDTRRAPTPVERGRASRTPAPPVPVAVAGRGDVTEPYELVERPPTPEAKAVIDRAPFNASDYATKADIVNLAVELVRDRSASRQRDREAEAVLAGPHKAHRATRRNLIATIVAAAAAIAAAVKQWTEHPAAPDGSAAVRVELLQEAIKRLDGELVEIRRELGHRENFR